MDHNMQQDSIATEKVYSPPTLTEFGDIRSLTQGSGGNDWDGSNNSAHNFILEPEDANSRG